MLEISLTWADKIMNSKLMILLAHLTFTILLYLLKEDKLFKSKCDQESFSYKESLFASLSTTVHEYFEDLDQSKEGLLLVPSVLQF